MHPSNAPRLRLHLMLVLTAVAAMGTHCVAPEGVEGTVTRLDDTTVCVDTGADEERCGDVGLLEDAGLVVGDCALVHLKQPSGDLYRVETC